MKKILIGTGSLLSSSNRLFPLLQSFSFASLNGLRHAQFSSTVPENLSEEKADLIITELTETDKVKKKDSVERATNKTLLLNAFVDWSSQTTEFPSEDGRTSFSERPEKKYIQFKISTKQLFAKYPNAEKLCISVQKSGFNQQTFFEIILENPLITAYNPELVTSNISQLMRLGFSIHEIKRVVRQYPNLLEYEGYDVFETFETWRKGGLFERFLINLFTNHPLLFSISNDQIAERLKRLNYMMLNKINRVTATLERNPSIMDGDWERVENNFEFLYRTMRVTEKDISRSKALSLPLPLISLRFTFLTKCGVYIRPKLKEERGFKEHKNPSLSAIVDSPDEIFSINVAKVSLDEYLVFKKLMKYEDTDQERTSFEEKI